MLGLFAGEAVRRVVRVVYCHNKKADPKTRLFEVSEILLRVRFLRTNATRFDPLEKRTKAKLRRVAVVFAMQAS